MWYEGVFAAQGAGTGLTDIWDAHVVENDCWSVYDAAAGANAKVYRHPTFFDVPDEVGHM